MIRLVSGPGPADRYGDPTEADIEPVELPDAFVAPRPGDAAVPWANQPIDGRGRQGVIVGLTMYVPGCSTIDRTSRVEIDGTLYDIEGEPGVWADPSDGLVAGVEVALRRAAG